METKAFTASCILAIVLLIVATAFFIKGTKCAADDASCYNTSVMKISLPTCVIGTVCLMCAGFAAFGQQ